MTDNVLRTPLWDDNPSEVDLLGFDAVVAPIVDAIVAEELDPLTIGVHAKWGGGKSTVLNLIDDALFDVDGVRVVSTNPWEFDDHEDVKGTIIAEVLDGLREHFDQDAGLTEKIGELLGRISWSRVGTVVAKGVLTQTLDFAGLAEALKPKSRNSPESMAGFKTEFGKLIDSLPDTRRIVVLVDDLDRCMPSATVATLEAIKLFLSVSGMVFVIAADQDMVRDAIAMNLGGSPESSRYAQRYLDKIVQLPASLPFLPAHEADAYLGLLLAKAGLDDDAFTALVAHASDRRKANKVPLLSEMDGLAAKPDDDTLRLASQLVHGLRSDKVVNPREIKRFLNAFQVRNRIAQARGVSVRADVLAKLLLLEDRFRVDFEKLVNTPDLERKTLLDTWQKWASGEGSAKPEGVSEDSREWAAAEPDLSSEKIGPYLTLAASLAITRQSGTPLDAELAALLAELTGDSETLRRTAVDKLVERSEDDQRIAIEALFAQARRQDEGGSTISSLIDIAGTAPALAQDVAAGLKESCWKQIDVGNAVEMASSKVPEIATVARQLAEDEVIDAEVRQAALNVLDGGTN
ncbi:MULTISPECIES: KAP family P-loop NTPase fold protein [Mycobacterium]|uniref:ATPase n=1 Tax=Mycobacterium pseudoshottsii TaxID=265949 RepID=A0A9N7LRR8_9MYCO|nr:MULTISPECIES: P-loop NTPase fold protein [Mycobacterium]EPQ47862.1 Phage T7 exclusion protein [Mycobacterium sp. 012931]BDN82351.1 ATPase [Mycobacterium pseudoshottsii]BEH76745.1 ATPase [Mycobacterium pseudoshottsii]